MIGPGGKISRKIISETETTVDVDDEGKITICGVKKEGINKAISWIEDLTREVQVGEEFEGEVKRIQPFGAFVQVLPGKDGLVHVSKMSVDYVSNPHDVLKIGQKVKVKVVEIDNMGRINLTMLFGEDDKKASTRNNNRPRPDGRNFQRSKRPRSQREDEKFSSLHFKKEF